MVYITSKNHEGVILYSHNIIIKLMHTSLMKLLTSNESEMDLGYGLKLIVNLSTGGDALYTFKQFDRDFNFKHAIIMNNEEWKILIQLAVDVTPPITSDEVCVLCRKYVPADFHVDCDLKKRVAERLMCTKFGMQLLEALCVQTEKNHEEMFGEIAKTEAHLHRAYGCIIREDVWCMISEKEMNNELSSLEHFRNVKALLLNAVFSRIIPVQTHWY